MACLSELALAQGAGGHVVRPNKTGNTRSKPAKMQSAKVVIDGMQYKINGKSATLIKGKDTPTVSIPRNVSYKGINFPVTKIGCEAFERCEQLVSITIPNSVKIIERDAFTGCMSLKDMFIPNGVQTLGVGVFRKCTSLSSITFPSSLIEIGRAYFDLENLKHLKVEKGNSKYDSRDNCNAIIETSTNKLILGSANTIIPHSVRIIGEDAFSHRNSLTSIVLPNGITEIQLFAFSNTNITTITIPSSIRRIGYGAFNDCEGLKKVIVTDIAAWCSIEFDDPYSNPLYYARHLYYGEAAITNLIIPDGVEKIGANAFRNCIDIVSVTIPSSVQTIGEDAFEGCKNLTSIEIPNSVTSIECGAFASCRRLETVVIPKSVKVIGSLCFYNCPLNEVKIPAHTRLHTSENGEQDVFPSNTKIVRY